jgi:hypothetical protein
MTIAEKIDLVKSNANCGQSSFTRYSERFEFTDILDGKWSLKTVFFYGY